MEVCGDAAITAIAASLVIAVTLTIMQPTVHDIVKMEDPVEILAQRGIQTEDVETIADFASQVSRLRGSDDAMQKEETTIALNANQEPQVHLFFAQGEIAQFSSPLSESTQSMPEESVEIASAKPRSDMGSSGGGTGGMGGMQGGGEFVPQQEAAMQVAGTPSMSARGGRSADSASRNERVAQAPPAFRLMSPNLSLLGTSDALPRDRSVAGNVIPGRVPETAREGIRPMPMPQVPPMEMDRETRLGWRGDSYNDQRNEAYKDFTENDFTPVKMGEFSTFSIDVDTASYTTMRRFINMEQRPPADSVRLEEYINYFKYDYAQPTDGKPFATHVDVFPCPWQPDHLLARVGIKGKEYTIDERPPLNLVFLIDVSGSMSSENRLPLVKKGLTELVEMLQPKDRVAIVTYAGSTQVVLPSVSGQEKRAILDSINALSAGGSTAGASGIKLAYETARRYYDKEAQNRVILCTDGDFNVGTTDNKTLEQMIGDEAKSGVFLTILGFGMGNYKDDRLKMLSMRGNGNYGYIDTIEECQKLLVEGLTSTLFTIAKDVKIQVDFNPAAVSGYRLLGYENRKLRDEDFHNDAVDAGEIGAGHTVTALYEIVPAGVKLPTAVDQSRYDTDGSREPATVSPEESPFAGELMFVKLRYKEPEGDKSSLLEYPVKATVSDANADSKFASAVALYGMLLRSSRHSGKGTWDTVLELAVPNVKEDKYRKEFVDLVKKGKEMR